MKQWIDDKNRPIMTVLYATSGQIRNRYILENVEIWKERAMIQLPNVNYYASIWQQW